MDAEHKKKIGELLTAFEGKVVTNELLDAYCKRHHIEPVMVMSQYEDYIFQFQHDRRFTTVMPLLLNALQKLTQPEEFVSPEEHKKFMANNDMIELEMAKILEDNGILWDEAQGLISNFGILIAGVIERTKNRVKNMGEATMLHVTTEQLGKPLTLKALSTRFAEEAEKLM